MVVPSLLMLLGLAIIPWGGEVFHEVHHWLRKLPLGSYFSTAVQVGSYASLLGMGCIIYLLDRKRARYLTYLVCALSMAGAINTVVKQVAGRSRPEWSVSMSKDKRQELEDFAAAHKQYAISINKEDSWLGIRRDRPFFMDRYTSFPSGHACGALTIAAFLSVLYPAARKFWITVGVSCALARVYGERHYLEDVLVGGSLGWIVAMWVFSWEWPMLLGNMILSSRRKNPEADLLRHELGNEGYDQSAV